MRPDTTNPQENPQGLSWVDSHCHLSTDDADEQVDAARAAGVDTLVVVGTDVENSREALQVADRHRNVWATAGVHPHEASKGLDGLSGLLDESSPVAVGECGLDYHYDHSPRPIQKQAFSAQIALAHERKLSLVVHSRSAWDDTFAILISEGLPTHTIFHCFTGGPAEAERALSIGAFLSFSGIITFPNAFDVREAAASCPSDRILVETDSPYLSPVPMRGKPNTPANLPFVGAEVARSQGVDLHRIAEITSSNAARAFGLTTTA